ncbi:MAG: thrombospondin, partial [Phycisphaerales bacterium]|nr:thrombospondin [Phycisphaerales bacterium]
FATAGTAAGTSYADAGLAGSARYVYRVRARDATGAGAASDLLAIVNRPSAVTGLRTTTLSGGGQVVLDWLERPDSAGETGYRIERSADGGATFATAGTVGPNVVIFSDPGVSVGRAYTYRVVPTSAGGDGPAATVAVTTQLPAVAGLAFAARTTTSLSLAWSDLASESGYRVERSLDGSAWATLATLAAGTKAYADAGLATGGEYYYRVTGVDAAGNLGAAGATVFSSTAVPAQPTPPLTGVDVGGGFATGGGGATVAGAAAGAYTVVAAGTAGVGGTSDQFRFSYKSVTGDGEIVARVTALEDTNAWAEVGVMFRESTVANTRFASMSLFANASAGFLVRPGVGTNSTGTQVDLVGGAKATLPYWVKLVRTGNVFTGYASADGAAWVQVGEPTTVTMPATVLVGLSVASRSADRLNTAVLEGVSVEGANRPPTAANDAVSTDPEVPATVAVLANDADPDGDPLTVTAVSAPAHGTAAANPNGTITYVPAAGYAGADAFAYTVSDGRGGTATAAVAVTVRAPNRPPVAAADAAAVPEDQTVTVAVLANDVDPDGDPLTVTVAATSGPLHGSATVNQDRTVTYRPAADYNGPDGFTYVVSDGKGGTATAAVTITVTPVNDAPVARNMGIGAFQNTPFPLAFAQLPVSDADGDPLVLTGIAVAPAHGTAALAPGGGVTYTPARDYVGSDEFRYAVSDGNGGVAVGLVSVYVNPRNRLPVVLADAAVTAEDTQVVIDALANDSDPDGQPLTIVSFLSDPLHGTATINPDNTITYRPAPNFNGLDGFNYRVSDTAGGVEAGFIGVTVTPVNDAPVALPLFGTTWQNAPLTVAPAALPASDPDGDPLSVTAASAPAHGTVALAFGGLTYTPAPGYSGPDAFTYTVSDGRGGVATADATVTVNPRNTAPVAGPDAFTTPEDVVAGVAVLTNDADADGQPLTVTAIPTAPAHGTATVRADGRIEYRPAPDYNGPDGFTYEVADPDGATALGRVTITVTPVNDAPVPGDVLAEIAEDTGLFNVDIVGGVIDADRDPLILVAVGRPASGATLVLNADRTITYRPPANFTGVDTFAFTLSDNKGGVGSGTAYITVTPVNDAPTVAQAARAAAATVTGTTVGLSALGADVDAGQAALLTYRWVLASGPAAVTFAVNGTAAARATTATFAKPGAYAFRVTITDPAGATVGSTTATVNVVRTTKGVQLTPATATVRTGGTVQLAAKAVDQFGVPMATQPAFAWAMASGGGRVSATGLFTAPTAAGTSVVRATAGGFSATAAVTVLTVPAAPTALVAAKLANRQVKLTWRDNAANETGFYVQTSTNGSTWTTLSTRPSAAAGTLVTYTTGTLAAGKRYFRVIALNAVGQSAASNVVTVTL